MSIKLTFNEKKQVRRSLITQVKAAKVTMATLGPVLSAYEVNINNICKAVNSATGAYPASMPINIILTIFQDKTFVIIVNGPSSTFLLKAFKTAKNEISLLSLWRIYKIKLSFQKDFSFKELVSTTYSAKLIIT